MNIFADIGNTAIKWGEIATVPTLSSSEPHGEPTDLSQAFSRIDRVRHFEPIAVSPSNERRWWISSVHGPAAEWLQHWIESSYPKDQVEWISRANMPIEMDLDQPETVGLDRLLGSVAVNARRSRTSGAIYCDFGTATTINLLSPKGVFQGGAILPGIQTQLNALSRATDRLPEVDWKVESAPDSYVGKNTRSAILSGVVHGHACGVTEMVRRIADRCEFSLELWLTGGGVPNVELQWPIPAQFAAHLVLEGIGHYAYSVCSGQ